MNRTRLLELSQILVIAVTFASLMTGEITTPPARPIRCVPRAELDAWACDEGAEPPRAAAWASGIWRLAELEAAGLDPMVVEQARVVLVGRLKAGGSRSGGFG